MVSGLLIFRFWFSAFLPHMAFTQDADDPEYNFEYLWKTFDANYATFTVKHIDWKALYNVYRPRVTANTSEDEQVEIISNMPGHLNDNHVQLISRDPQRVYSAGYLMEMLGKEGIAKVMEMLEHRPVHRSKGAGLFIILLDIRQFIPDITLNTITITTEFCS